MKLPRYVSLWIPVILWEALIYYLSNIPGLELTSEPVANFISRKSAHIVEYAILFLLLYRALGRQRVWLALLLTILTGILDEYHQSFVPRRTAKDTDILFDTIGALVGVGIGLWLLPRKRHN